MMSRLCFVLVLLAARVPDDEKKNFCENTSQVFHGEFARLISVPLAHRYPFFRYHLFAEGELVGDPYDGLGSHFLKVDNVKAQFRCPNVTCGRSWTSMRARISFKTSPPHTHGFVVLKIFGQFCQGCGAMADALWYMGTEGNVALIDYHDVLSHFRGGLSRGEESLECHL